MHVIHAWEGGGVDWTLCENPQAVERKRQVTKSVVGLLWAAVM
jgi:hypothetical protein